jgi:cell shape-determining protein MreC
MQLVSVAVLALVVVGVVALVRGPLASVVWRAGSPFLSVRVAAANYIVAFFSSTTSSNHSLALENARLRAELASTTALVADRDLLYSENVELRSRLGRLPTNASSVLAAILLRPPAVPYDTLLLDVGRNAGVEPGDVVAAGGSLYLGTIKEVYATSARVVLYSAPGQSYSALLVNTAATSSLALSVVGQGSGSLTAEVPAAAAVSVGDHVLFPSITPELIAKVVFIDDHASASFKTIYMQLPINMNALRFVEVRRAVPTVQ